MAMTMHVDIVSAEQEIYSGTCEEVYAPAEMGEIGIMPRHSQLVTRLKAGEVRVKPEGKTEMEHIFVSGVGLNKKHGKVPTTVSSSLIKK